MKHITQTIRIEVLQTKETMTIIDRYRRTFDNNENVNIGGWDCLPKGYEFDKWHTDLIIWTFEFYIVGVQT